jgi:hypothetical protein
MIKLIGPAQYLSTYIMESEEEIVIPNRPGYSVRTYENRLFLVPRVLEVREVLGIGLGLLPNLEEAFEMPSGVSSTVWLWQKLTSNIAFFFETYCIAH